MIYEYGILSVSILFSILLIINSWKKFRNRQFLRFWVNFSTALFLLSISLFFAAFVTDLSTYERLTREYSIASIKFHSLGQQHYEAVLTKSNKHPVFFELHGDQWQLDTRLIKWKGAAAWAGLKPLYQLDRLTGRYRTIKQEKNSNRSIYALYNDDNTIVWQWLIEYQDFIPWLDAYYGNAIYLPMSHGAKYDITINSSGLIARPENEKARQSLQHWLAPT